MTPDEVKAIGVSVVCTVPVIGGIIYVLTQHQQRMTALMQGKNPDAASSEIDELRNEVRALRALVAERLPAAEARSSAPELLESRTSDAGFRT